MSLKKQNRVKIRLLDNDQDEKEENMIFIIDKQNLKKNLPKDSKKRNKNEKKEDCNERLLQRKRAFEDNNIIENLSPSKNQSINEISSKNSETKLDHIRKNNILKIRHPMKIYYAPRKSKKESDSALYEDKRELFKEMVYFEYLNEDKIRKSKELICLEEEEDNIDNIEMYFQLIYETIKNNYQKFLEEESTKFNNILDFLYNHDFSINMDYFQKSKIADYLVKFFECFMKNGQTYYSEKIENLIKKLEA